MAIEIITHQPDSSFRPQEETVLDQNGKRLTGHWALVTGAGRGIGAEIAHHFASAGSSLVLTELPQLMDQLEEVAADLRAKYGIEVKCELLDLRSIDGIEAFVRSIEQQGVELNYLINNAGVNLLSPALNLSQEEWDFVVDTNLKGTFFLTREAAKVMVRKKRGSIVMIASQHGVVGNENRAPYCASKAGIIHLTKALAIEWAKYGIRVNAVSPTFVITDANEQIINDPQFQRANLPRVPLRKFARPEDIAQAVLFLATDTAGMITGHNLVVDGGWTII